VKYCLVVTVLALLSCGTQPPVDPLEAKARDGDPVAACQLAVRSLHNCALEKQRWEKGELATRPACIEEGISKRDQAYLDKAVANLESHKVSQLSLLTDQVLLATGWVLLEAGPADKAIAGIEKLQPECANLADLSKI
jgi:hypothetical protein